MTTMIPLTVRSHYSLMHGTASVQALCRAARRMGYDRLALTITGEQLSEIYLDTRRALELENRGGARAKIDEVEILNVHSIGQPDDGGFAVDLTWTVSGSVSHFGHTHYRRNRYRAVVVILETGGHWKIRSIQVVEQQRVL